MSAFFDLASLVLVPSGYKSGKIYAQRPLTTDGQLTFTRASTATRVNASGLIESVASGVPRLDYTNSSCPKLLLEPQRTNFLSYSQDFSNASWGKSGSTTLTHSQTDPNGGTTATRVQMTSGALNYFFKGISGNGSQNIALSVWIKGTSSSGSISLNTGTAASRTGTRVNYTTTWTRYVIIQNETTSNTGFQIDNYSDSLNQVAADFLISFAQAEAGAYATSYIPTTSAAVTRLADAAEKTSISSLIGQTEGVIFWDITDITGTPTGTGNPDFGIRNTAYTNWIGITTNSFASPFRVVVRPISGGIIDYTANITTAKAAVAWSSAGAVLYVNGVQVATSAVNPNFSFDTIQMLGSSISYKTKQALLFKTRLTNAQLAELTTL